MAKKYGARSPLSRRGFLRTSASAAGAAGVAASGLGSLIGCGGDDDVPMTTPDAGRRETQLRILGWTHFVPGHDVWFDTFARAWGEANGVEVVVERVPFNMVRPTFMAEMESGTGHDLYEWPTPQADLEPHVVSLNDMMTELEARHGTMIPLCRQSCFNPRTNNFYALNHGWAPDPANFRSSLWSGVGMPQGPSSWQQLLEGGRQIKAAMNVHVGIGLAGTDPDANMACRALLWSYGASVQSANAEVVINSPQSIAAVEFMRELYADTMVPEVLAWGAADNNIALVEGRASYIINSISAYRTAQANVPATAADIFFGRALMGPATALVGAHANVSMMVARHARNPNAAQDFMLHLVEHYNEVVYNSALYNLPAFPSTTPQLTGDDGWLAQDPFESEPANKLSLLTDAESWSTNVGYPGAANPAVGEVLASGIVPQMFLRAANGEMTSEQAVQWAEDQIAPIYERWRAEGLI
ncbi:ABC transporter substrate-binding protein [Sandaracinus amylolyticus]|uniref:ABC transporter substrate-binding protein n=1 Tax=Sandaracinus amylolyticus TaxID=927083 RepID=UPI001F30C023|nr:ABC transporter substrate-binding protein [Sandaracinus amylolyticus]UJR82640.1 Hypothetical protein I5071_47050 [Sandaracinus amylolyticus]